MKRLSKVFLPLMMLALVFGSSIFGSLSVYAESKGVEVVDVKIKDKSSSISVEEPTISENRINSAIAFNELNDFVTFALSLKNTGTDKFKITSIYDNNTSEYIAFSYGYHTDYIEANDTITIAINIAYVKQLINQNLSFDNAAIMIDYEREDGTDGEFIFVPDTGFFTNQKGEVLVENIAFTIVIVVLAVAGIVLIVVRKKFSNTKKHSNVRLGGVLILLLAVLLTPFAVFAIERLELSVVFTDLKVLGEFEVYNITIYPGGDSEPIVREITYGEPIGPLEATEIFGYDFDKWVDGDSNEVNSDTIVTGEMTVEARYAATNYSIEYIYNNGTLPDGETNPETYTIEANTITLVNPSRTGYTFTGWTGSNGNIPETTVTIAAGSTGSKTYTANFEANTDTQYTVINAYQDLYDETHYEDAEPIIYYGTTDSTVDAPISSVHGFVDPEVQSVKIEADGSATVHYYYDRDYFDFSLDKRDRISPDCTYYNRCTPDGTYPYGSTIHIELARRDGYKVEWNNGDAGDQTTFELADDIALSYDDLPIHYFVRYNPGAEDVTGEMADHEFIYDEEQALHSNEFVREGYTFGGWRHGDDWWSHTAPENWVTKNLTTEEGGIYNFYATWWIKKYDVRYYDEDADKVLWMQYSIEHGSLAPTPTFTPTKPLYNFVGWYTDNTYTTEYDFETMKITGPTTIYAKFDYLCTGFGNDSWDKIVSDLAENPDLYPVGCKKEVEMDVDDDGDEETVLVKLVNTSTPDVCANNGFSQTACGPVLEFENPIGMRGINVVGDNSYSSDGGWKEASLTTWLNRDFYDRMPEDLRSVIIPTAPIVSGSGSSGVSDDIEIDDFGKTYLYLPSGRELGFDLAHDNKKDEATDTRILDFYTGGSSWDKAQRRKKTDLTGEPVEWWTRTADFTYDWIFYYVQKDGTDRGGGSNSEKGVVSMFRIGTIPEYTVSFDTDGAEAIEDQTVQYGDLVSTPLDNPVKEHYEFKGWYADSNFEHEFDFGKGVTSNTTIYAKFEIIKLDVSFDTDGGSAVDVQAVDHGQHATRPNTDPEKPHYDFGGWYTDDGFGTEFDFANTVITEDTIIYAKFIPHTYTVSFNVDGGSEVESQEITYPGKATRPNEDPEKETHRFDGWFTDDGFGTEFDFDETTIEGDTTIYAKFTLITHTVTFNTDGGSEIAAQTVGHNQYATRPEDTPVKGSLEFYDWFTDAEYSTLFDFNSTKITDDTTVYARYKTAFATDSWMTIKNSLVIDPNFYDVGSEKEVELDIDNNGTPESYTVRLANTSTHDVCNNENYSQTACGLVVEFVDLVESTQMNHYDSDVHAWNKMDFMKWLNEDFYPKLPADLREVMVPTYPIVSSSVYGGKNSIGHANYNWNRLYIPSGREVGLDFGDDDNARDVNVDTRTLDYYISHPANSSKIKKDLNGTARAWWLRTAKFDSEGEFFVITASGASTISASTTPNYYSPVFRIGNAPEYTVTFNTDGGTEISSQTVKYAGTVTRPQTDPLKDGTQFEDWYADSEFASRYHFDDPVIEDKTIYAYYKDKFGLDSWATIKSNLANDPNYYAIGSRKIVEMDMNDDGNTEPYIVRLANTSTPDVCRNSSTMSQTACGVVIEFVTTAGIHRMNSWDTTDGGWKSTEMVDYLNNEFYNKIPEDLRSIIIPTYPIASGRYTSSTSPDITAEDTAKNKLYLLSAREIGANTKNQDTRYDDNRTLDYYVGTNPSRDSTEPKRRKKNVSDGEEMWWLRTAKYDVWNTFYVVYANGLVQFNFGSQQPLGVAPAFRILSYSE